MKKLFAIAAAAALALSMSTTALAATSKETVTADNGTTNPIPVNIEVTGVETVAISVDIDFSDFAFAYEVKTATWDAKTGKYTGLTGEWKNDAKSAITVTNHSNVPISVVGDFESTREGYDKVKVAFEGGTKGVVIDTPASGDSAVNEKAVEATISGAPTVNETYEGSIGTVTLTISNAS